MDDLREFLEEEVIRRFTRFADDPGSERRIPVGPQSAKDLGYDPGEVDALPPEAASLFTGVGNALSLGAWEAGWTVLDVGSGAGLDSLLVARRIGDGGRVIGGDMTQSMIARAQEGARIAGVKNAEFRLGRADALPVEDRSVDADIMNGVFNLCVDKRAVVGELGRVLRPGGALRIADVLLEEHVTSAELTARGAWSD